VFKVGEEKNKEETFNLKMCYFFSVMAWLKNYCFLNGYFSWFYVSVKEVPVPNWLIKQAKLCTSI
jgi:hypothetical protein